MVSQFYEVACPLPNNHSQMKQKTVPQNNILWCVSYDLYT